MIPVAFAKQSENKLHMTLDDENEDILVQIQEEQRQLPRHLTRRLHQEGT